MPSAKVIGAALISIFTPFLYIPPQKISREIRLQGLSEDVLLNFAKKYINAEEGKEGRRSKSFTT